MTVDNLIKKKIKKLEERFPGTGEDLEKELIPLSGEEVRPMIKKKKN